jgi:hypothetical protein
MAAYMAALFGVGLLQRRSFLSGLKRLEKPNSIKKYFIAFNSSPAHPPFASYNHVLAKHS